MDKTENEPFSSPADYKVYDHIVVVYSNLVRIAPLWKGASIAKKTAKPRKAAVSDPGEWFEIEQRCKRQTDRPHDSAMHRSLFKSLCQVSSDRHLFLRVDKVKEQLSDEGLCLIFEMACEDRVQVDELQIRQ